MNIKLPPVMAGLFAAVCCAAAVPPAQAENNGGLDAGLTVNEIKEILVQLYAYAGFPRSLNAIGTFMEVIEERGRPSTQWLEKVSDEQYGAKSE